MSGEYMQDPSRQRSTEVLYWSMRLGMAFIWIWTAAVSWFVWPHAQSLEWLRRLGVTSLAEPVFVAACLVDLSLGVASCVFATRRLWQLQFALVVSYSLAVAIALPEFLVHPFGPITKNVAVLACLAWLVIVERRA